MSMEEEALRYHQEPTPGKVQVISSKPCDTDWQLSLAYSPGVAEPCKEIAKNPQDAYKYTTKGNLVGVVTNGTAVLGLGNIGPLAAKPVMEGKGVLFKQFAGINVFDIELNANSIEDFVHAAKALEPTFGGINLEDIKAPECFEIEKRLKEALKIPVFHDDQHGTAIISGAAILNAAALTGRKLESIKMVINGAGAAAVACGKLFVSLGVKQANIFMCDSQGVIYKGRKEGMNPYKEEFAVDTKKRTLAEALEGADCFVGLSVKGAVTEAMLLSMAPKPIVFAMANPDPEIHPDLAKKIRPDCIMATGRSDFPNQVNNVLGYPYIFRGALDTAATTINEEMKLAAVHAIAELAREEVPEKVSEAYGGRKFKYGPEYIIPKPFDPRVLLWVAPAVAKAAMDSGVAQQPIKDFEEYRDRLYSMQGRKIGFVRTIINRVRNQAEKVGRLPKLIFPEANSPRILKACNRLVEERVAHPVLVGFSQDIQSLVSELKLEALSRHLEKEPVIDTTTHSRKEAYRQKLYEMRQRKGVNRGEAERMMFDPQYWAAMAVHLGDADGLVTGATNRYSEAVLPILQVIGAGKRGVASGLNILLLKDRMVLCADTAVNIDPTAEQLASIAIHAAKVSRYFKMEPRIAMLSYTNFTGKGDSPKKMRQAAELVRKIDPTLAVDGEIQADAAVNAHIMEDIASFSKIKGGANILIFPNLDTGNIAYKLAQQFGDGEVVGPFIMGINKAANVVQRTGNTEDVFNTAVMTALESQALSENEISST